MILLRLIGGMGNQLFQYAAATTLAKQLNTFVKLDLSLLTIRPNDPHHVARDYELHAFDIKEEFATEEEIKFFNPLPKTFLARVKNKIRTIVAPPQLYLQPDHGYDANFFRQKDNTCIVGSFQSEKFFDRVHDEIKTMYRFKKKVDAISANVLKQIETTNSVCLHVRRGDYVSNAHYSELIGAKTTDYYYNGLTEILKLQTDVTVFIFSDDIAWCKQNIKLNVPMIFMDDVVCSTDHHIQLNLMSRCKHFIISNSSFSWWAAWLGNYKNKIVIAPKVWFADGSQRESDIIPDRWVKM
jgi:Glycosyl transferase family 11